MDDESLAIKLARMEEKLELTHKIILEALIPLKQRQEEHHDDIAIIKRDNKWIMAISGTAFSGAVYALWDKFIGK